jgi:hypothetical protein
MLEEVVGDVNSPSEKSVQQVHTMIKITVLIAICLALSWASEVNTPQILKSNGRYRISQDLAFMLLVIVLSAFTGSRTDYNDRLWDNYEQNADILMNKRESRRKQRSFLLFLFPHRIRDTIRGSRPSGRLPLFLTAD